MDDCSSGKSLGSRELDCLSYNLHPESPYHISQRK